MASARTLAMVGVYCATIDGSNGILDEASLVERISMYGHLHIVFFCHL